MLDWRIVVAYSNYRPFFLYHVLKMEKIYHNLGLNEYTLSPQVFSNHMSSKNILNN